MKKNVLFLIAMVVVVVLLGMLSVTGIAPHIGLAVVGLIILIAYTVTTKKEWKLPALEIIHRVCYAVALITGVVLMKVHGVAALVIVHQVSASLFAVILVVCEIHKMVKK